LTPIVGETSRKISRRFLLENQQRNFLMVCLPEHADTQEKFARIFRPLYAEKTIEWE
jgi:hypothetical protein